MPDAVSPAGLSACVRQVWVLAEGDEGVVSGARGGWGCGATGGYMKF